MKKGIYILIGTALWLSSCTGGSKNTDAVISETASTTGHYGEFVSVDRAVTVSEMFTTLQQTGSFDGKVKGEISEVCKSKGCWMTLELPDGNKMRVTFKDYSFFVPTQSSGYMAVIEGKAARTITDVETLRHFAEDEGLPSAEIQKINSPKEEYTFEAEGVLIQEI
ncbi:DUF4920 domain-containing protein [Anditalea andensis]|uniref:Branched-chain amino acid aminotransferase n=1 Tax=Anditalea andensis TaxID=1048983 RepID=A0A074KX17_9BACT|nr:DUF4920 domain-containing protein [Anditalea andensis]KEO74526.1 hypothetical protein EL17_02300 [Anditalea andensis]